MVGMSAGMGTSGVVCVNGRDVCWCGDFWSSVCVCVCVCVNGRDVCWCEDFWSSVCVNGRDVCWCGDFWSSACEW